MTQAENYKDYCPILIILEDPHDPISSNSLRKLLPFLKEWNFESLALEEMSTRSVDFLMNSIYKPLAAKEIFSASDSKKHSNMYALLKESQKNEIDIQNIDYSQSEYLKANLPYEASRKPAYKNLVEKLNDKATTTVQKHISNQDNNLLRQDLASSYFTKNPGKYQSQTLAKHSAEDYYISQDIIDFIKYLLNEPFNAERSIHFADQIDDICKSTKAGIAVLLGNFHGVVTKLLKDNEYNVKSYYIKSQSHGNDLISKFLSYNDEVANDLLFYNLTKVFEASTPQESIITQIQTEIEEFYYEMGGLCYYFNE